MTDVARIDLALRPNPNVVAKRLDEATVLVNVATSRIFELNETAGRVWELIGEAWDKNSIVCRLVEEFEVEEARAAAEVEDLLVRFRSEGLLVT